MRRRRVLETGCGVLFGGTAGCLADGRIAGTATAEPVLREVQLVETVSPSFDELAYEIRLDSGEVTRSTTAVVEVTVTNVSERSVTVEENGDRFPFQGLDSEDGKWLLIEAGQDGVDRTTEECAQLAGNRYRFEYPFGWNPTELPAGDTRSVRLELWAASAEWARHESDSCMPVGTYEFETGHRIGNRKQRVALQLSIGE